MFNFLKENEILKKMREIILQWEYENGTQKVADVMKAIEQDPNLLEQYFTEIDWTKVDKTSIHKKLFEPEKERTKKSRR